MYDILLYSICFLTRILFQVLESIGIIPLYAVLNFVELSSGLSSVGCLGYLKFEKTCSINNWYGNCFFE